MRIGKINIRIFIPLMILIIGITINAYSQFDVMSISTDQVYFDENKIDDIKNDMNFLIKLKKESKNDNEKIKLQEKIDKLNYILKKYELESNEIKLTSEEAKKLYREFLKENFANDKLIVSGNISFNPGSQSGNSISPIVLGKYEKNLLETNDFNVFLNILLNIQSPIGGNDSVNILEKILNTGADGNLSVSGKFAKQFSDLFTISGIVTSKINWLMPKDFSMGTATGFGYFSGGFIAAINFGPLVFASQGEFNLTGNNQNNFLSKNLFESWAINLLIGLDISNEYQLQLKYLVTAKDKVKDLLNQNDNVQILIGASYPLF